MTIRAILFSCLVLLSGCKEQATEVSKTGNEAIKPLVLATNYPLYFFAGEIAGDVADVVMPEIEGDPAMWVPGPSDISQMQQADLVIINGAGYESWLALTSLPSGLVRDTTAEIEDQLLSIENTTLHQHGPQGEHSHEGTAFTTWLDPQIAIEQAKVISRELSLLLPTHAEGFTERLAALARDLADLDQALAKGFLTFNGQPVLFSHPVYQYLQQRYGLNAQSVHWEPDIEPGVKQWVDFQNLRQEHPARLMIWEDQPLQVMVDRLQQQGIRSIVFDPVANRPGNGNFFTVMHENVEQLLSK